jgi:hypothetical protein
MGDSGRDEPFSETAKVAALAAGGRGRPRHTGNSQHSLSWCGFDLQRERLEFLLDYLCLPYGNYG